uniref:Uncharacterized protein n=1 Tax=Arundo donax TaxID=35708 RepID=A0A0A9FYD4_ARUDO
MDLKSKWVGPPTWLGRPYWSSPPPCLFPSATWFSQ